MRSMRKGEGDKEKGVTAIATSPSPFAALTRLAPSPRGRGNYELSHSASSNMSCAFCAVADRRTVSPSISATSPAEM